MLTVICTQNFSILNLYRKSQFDENWMQKYDNFSVYRSQRTNVRIEKSNAWIINCELCTIDLTVWGFALIFDFLIISFCSVSTGRIKIFTQVRWSLQTECGYNNFDRLFIFLTVNQLVEDSVTLRCILII